MSNNAKSIIQPQEIEISDVDKLLGRYFKTKTLYKFENYDLEKLDVPLLQQGNKPYGTEEERAIRGLSAQNNLAIIQNFKIILAQIIFNFLSAQQRPITRDDQIFPRIKDYLKKDMEEMYRSLDEYYILIDSDINHFRAEFEAILQKFEIKTTTDESNLLFYLIYAEFAKNAMNMNCIVEWVKVLSVFALHDFIGISK